MILIGAGMADDDGTDDCRLLFVRQLQRRLFVIEFRPLCRRQRVEPALTVAV